MPPQRLDNKMQQHENDSIDTCDQVHSQCATHISHKQQPESRPQPEKVKLQGGQHMTYQHESDLSGSSDKSAGT